MTTGPLPTKTYCTRVGCDSWQFTAELDTGLMVYDAELGRAYWFCCWFCVGIYGRQFKRPIVVATLPDDDVAEQIANRRHD